jgi:hypothetical protein
VGIHDASYYDNPGISPFEGTDIIQRIRALKAQDHADITALQKTQAGLARALQKKIDKINKQIIAAALVLAREVGLVANRLADLSSSDGSRFTLKKTDWDDPKQANAKNGEQAYLCRKPHSKDSRTGCGWVKGTPIAKGYSDFGVLSGSAGANYLCHICGKQIGSHDFVQS